MAGLLAHSPVGDTECTAGLLEAISGQMKACFLFFAGKLCRLYMLFKQCPHTHGQQSHITTEYFSEEFEGTSSLHRCLIREVM